MGDRNDDLKKALEEALLEMDAKTDARESVEKKRTEEIKNVQKRLEEELAGMDMSAAQEVPETENEPAQEESEVETEAVQEEPEADITSEPAPENEPAPEPEAPETESAPEPEAPETESATEPEVPENEPAPEPKAPEAESAPEPETEEAESEKEETAAEPSDTGMNPEEQSVEPEAAESEAAEAEPDEKTKKKKSNWIYNVVIAIGVCMVLGGGFAIFQKYKNDADTKEMYSDLNNEFVTVNNETDTETELDWGFDWVSADGSSSYTSTVWYEQISVDFDGLNNINEDVVGWIYQENGEVSYPLMYSGDNEQYLRHTLYDVESTSGSIFIGGENQPDMSDDLTMIYGHNMKNGSMFGSLKQYKEDDSYYANHQYIQIYTEDGMAYRYQVYAYFDIDDNETAMEDLLFYDSEDETSAIMTEVVIQEGDDTQEEITSEVILNEENTYEAYLETIASRSILDTDIEVTTEDQVIGLWTCTASGTKRFLVFAVKIDEHNFNEVVETQEQDLNALDR